MSLLLDSHVLLWWLEGNPRLGSRVRDLLADPKRRVYVSAATVWEIGIKQALGKIMVPEALVDVIEAEGFDELPISARHAQAASLLPNHHRDPFDRMLAAQAMLENMRLVSHDKALLAYDVEVLRV